MHRYHAIVCYVPAPDELGPLLEQYREVLEQITGDGVGPGELLEGFRRERVSGPFTYPTTRPILLLKGADRPIPFEPVIVGWPRSELGRFREPWLELGLLVHASAVWDDALDLYSRWAAPAVWWAVDALGRAFGQHVFLTDEDDEGVTWAAIQGRSRSFWAFDLARLAADGHSLEQAPLDYHVESISGVRAAYHRGRWAAPPWAALAD